MLRIAKRRIVSFSRSSLSCPWLPEALSCEVPGVVGFNYFGKQVIKTTQLESRTRKGTSQPVRLHSHIHNPTPSSPRFSQLQLRVAHIRGPGPPPDFRSFGRRIRDRRDAPKKIGGPGCGCRWCGVNLKFDRLPGGGCYFK